MPVAATVLSLLGGFGPSLAALALVTYASGTAGLRRWLKRCLLWRVGWRWLVLAAAIHVALGGTLPPSPAVGHAWTVAANTLLILLVSGPLGEGFAWRGYALPALQARWGWRVASLFLGAVWAAWHLPLFFRAGTA